MMSLYIKDINPALERFEGWLDETMHSSPEFDPYYDEDFSGDCRGGACPSRQYSQPGSFADAGYNASEVPVGQEFRSGKLDFSLTRHAEGCGALIIASVVRGTEVAKKLAKGIVRAQLTYLRLTLGRSPMGLPLYIGERSENLTTLWLPGGETDSGGPISERSSYPNDPAEVDALLQRMQNEITAGLELQSAPRAT